MSMDFRKPQAAASRETGTVVYYGSGAPLLGCELRITSKEQADAVVDALLGRSKPAGGEKTLPAS